MHHILYTFRRCPYAMRSRLAIRYSGIRTECREVDLNNIPQSLQEISAKATVPVLLMPDGNFLDESWDIVKWAVAQNDPEKLAGEGGNVSLEAEILVEMNDYSFKDDLDHYKYADRYPEHPAEYYREQGELFLQELEPRLIAGPYLVGNSLSVADIGIFPFIRQFALVDRDWFDQAPYPKLRDWLNAFLHSSRYESKLYTDVMHKHPIWQPGDAPIFLN